MRPQHGQLSVLRYGAFVSRTTEQRICSLALPVRQLVHDHFGRRPLGSVTITLTKPRLMPRLAAEAQGDAIGAPESVWRRAELEITRRPNDIFVATVIAPKNAVWMLVNATRARQHPQALKATLLHGFIEVDQLYRKGGFERRAALVRHELGVKRLRKPELRSLLKHTEAEEREAEQLVQHLVRRA